jgi:dihydroflavonol-4-reductase
MHTASPYLIDVKDPQRDLVDPAVNGTLNVLTSAKTAGVRRFILTSSMSAISDEPIEGKIFSEADWNEQSSLARNPYYYSKTVAEQAAWTFTKEQSPPFDLIVINPFMVIGPSLGPELNTSNKIFRDILSGVYPGVLNLTWGLVDVRDVAKAHVLAMESDGAHGRYLTAGEALSMQQIVAILREAGYDRGYKLPRLDLTSSLGTMAVRLISHTQPAGTGSYLRTHLGKVMRYDTSKVRRELGLAFRPARESVLAAVESLVRWGHLKPAS